MFIPCPRMSFFGTFQYFFHIGGLLPIQILVKKLLFLVHIWKMLCSMLCPNSRHIVGRSKHSLPQVTPVPDWTQIFPIPIWRQHVLPRSLHQHTNLHNGRTYKAFTSITSTVKAWKLQCAKSTFLTFSYYKNTNFFTRIKRIEK